MEYNYADQLDLEWQCLLQEYLSIFSVQTNKKVLLPFDTILRQIFCSSDVHMENVSNYKDKELCEQCLTQCINFLLHRNMSPRKEQINFILNIAKYATKDEPCFINLNSSHVIEKLIYLVHPNNQTSDKDTNVLFLDLLSSFLEHHSGINWLKATRCWVQAYALILDDQDKKEGLCNSGYKFLTQLLEKSPAFDKSFCCDIFQVISGPLWNTSDILKSHPSYPVCDKLIENIKSSAACVVRILEQILHRYSSDVLHCVVILNIDIACDILCTIINDDSVKLVLYRIVLIISFFKVTDIFDGIKFIYQDPLSVTGLLRIIESEVEKGSMYLVYELYYYALKYLTYISDKIPKVIINNKNIDIEIELATLQLEGHILIGNRLNSNFLSDLDADTVRKTLVSKMLHNLSFDALKIGTLIKRFLPSQSIRVYTNMTKYIIKSRYLYSKATVGIIFEGLVYSLQDTTKFILQKHTIIINDLIEDGFFEFIETLLEAILLFLKSFNLTWCDSVKILDLMQILNAGSTIFPWPVAINVTALKILQEVISRRLSPAMSLLIDYDEDLMNVGPILYQKCFTTEWEVRKAVLELIYTISKSANDSFPSFERMLTDASIPNLVRAMALNDENPGVKATALKCLNEMIVTESMGELLQKRSLLNKVLNMLIGKVESEVMVAATKLITTAYIQGSGLDDVTLVKAYETLENLALKINDGPVQVEAMQFWSEVFRKHLSNVGWIDQAFPAITFSKRIVTMTGEEVHKRIYKVLAELSANGCLKVLKKVSGNPDVQCFLRTRLRKIYHFFQTHNVTPDTIEMHQKLFNKRRALRNSDPETDPESVIQELINETIVKMISDSPDEQFSQYRGERSLLEICPQSIDCVTDQPIGEISPLAFVDFVYKWSANAIPDENERSLQETGLNRHDDYNIIDY